jgi:hypothetical protein
MRRVGSWKGGLETGFPEVEGYASCLRTDCVTADVATEALFTLFAPVPGCSDDLADWDSRRDLVLLSESRSAASESGLDIGRFDIVHVAACSVGLPGGVIEVETRE